jgi:carbon monoxide dehydrogenase subunit G
VELTNTFQVGIPVGAAWAALTDLDQTADAALTRPDAGRHAGAVKVEAGPVTARYVGTAWIAEKDDLAHRAVIRAEGADSAGHGHAAVTITATLQPRGSGTEVFLLTDLALSGRMAQLGGGVIAGVGSRLLSQFVAALEAAAPETLPVAPEALPVAPEALPVAPEALSVAPEALPAARHTLLSAVRGVRLTRLLPGAAAAIAVAGLLAWVCHRSQSCPVRQPPSAARR